LSSLSNSIFVNAMASIEGLPHVYISNENGCCFQSASRFNKPKPDELIAVDALLWQNFSFEIDQHVSKINVGLRTLGIILGVITAVLIILLLATQRGLILQDGETENMGNVFGIVLIVPFVIFFAFNYLIIMKNQKVDEEIKNVCQTFASKFNLKGFGVEYRTQHTGMFKPKYARATRAVVFPPVPSFQEDQTVDVPTVDVPDDGWNTVTNSGGIDHKSPVANSQNSQTNNDSNGFSDNNLLDPKLWGK